MKSNAEKAEALFQSVAKKYGGPPDAPPRRGFGSDALKVNGKIFAALSNGRLLLKLPRERVDALVTAKLAERFFDRRGAAQEGMGHDRTINHGGLVAALG
jgi:TfoX/Sxy family transcriptional regulator of competence genes